MPEHTYKTHVQLGSGGGGTVYDGQSRFELGDVERPCAIKVLHEDVAADAASVARFAREASLGYELARHPHLVGTRTFGVAADGRPYLVMDLEGPTLRDVQGLVTGQISVVWRLAAGLLQALLALQAHGYAHGDLNLGNVFLSVDGEVKLGDFGKSKALEDSSGDDRRALARVLALLAAGAPSIDRPEKPGALRPLPDHVPTALQALIAALADGSMTLAQAHAYVVERHQQAATPAQMRELARLGAEHRVRLDPEEFDEDEKMTVVLGRVARANPAAVPAPAPALAEPPAWATDLSTQVGRISAAVGPFLERHPPTPRSTPLLLSLVVSCACLAATLIVAAQERVVRLAPPAAPTANVERVPLAPEPAPVPAALAESANDSDAAVVLVPRAESPKPDGNETSADDRRRQVPERRAQRRDRPVRRGDETSEAVRDEWSASRLMSERWVPLNGSATVAGVAVSVDSAIWLSRHTLLVMIDLHNDTADELRDVTIKLVDARGISLPVAVRPRLAPSSQRVRVPAGGRESVGLEVPGADQLAGRALSLLVAGPEDSHDITVTITWP